MSITEDIIDASSQDDMKFLPFQCALLAHKVSKVKVS